MECGGKITRSIRPEGICTNSMRENSPSFCNCSLRIFSVTHGSLLMLKGTGCRDKRRGFPIYSSIHLLQISYRKPGQLLIAFGKFFRLTLPVTNLYICLAFVLHIA